MPPDWSRFQEIIQAHHSFLLTSHIRPDCDALGSELGMAQVLEALGKSVTIVNGQSTPRNFAFIDPQRRIKAIGEDISPDQLRSTDALIVLDTSAWAQLGPMTEVIKGLDATRLVVDHHVSQDDLGAELFKDTTAEATGRLVVDAAEFLNVKLTPAIANPLFAAIATDTGWYRFVSTTGNTFRYAGKLVDAGAEPAVIYRQLYEQDTLARLTLVGRILARTKTDMDGRLVYTVVLQEDFMATGALASDTEDVINMTLAVKGVEFAVIIIALRDGRCKISFRSRSELDCSKIAEQFGGGGHRAAAGATVDGPVDAALARVLDVVRSAMA